MKWKLIIYLSFASRFYLIISNSIINQLLMMFQSQSAMQQIVEEKGDSEKTDEAKNTTSNAAPETNETESQIITLEAVSVADPSQPPTEVQQFEELLAKTKSRDIDPYDGSEVNIQLYNIVK